MTIKHADLIRAVLDGKTVQFVYEHPDREDSNWKDLGAAVAIYTLARNDVSYRYRLKPEPRCVWTLLTGIGFHACAVYGQKPDIREGLNHVLLRHEFDPDTGEYLRTVKEDA